MGRRDSLDEVVDEEVLGLKLTKPERDVLMTSGKVSDFGLQTRVASAPPRQVVSFRIEELEDLHRGLAFDAQHTIDSKRRKTIDKVLRKIEDTLEESDSLDDELIDFGGDDLSELGLSTPPSASELFASIVGASVAINDQARCQITLNEVQRVLLSGMDTVSGDIHRLMRLDAPGEQEIELNPRQFFTLILALAESIGSSSDKKHKKLLEQIAKRLADGAAAAPKPSGGNGPGPGGPQAVAYQLKITLNGSKPAIWRRVVVPDCTLGELHQTIQVAMGWMNSHLHMFEYGRDRFSDPAFELDAAEYDETQVYLSQLVDDGCKKLRYIYDFGDDWSHTVQIEKTLAPKPNERLPKCVKGVGACPPEDCGGIWGYYEFLDAIRDPKHKRHDELVEWAGNEFDPAEFEIEETNKVLADGPVEGLDL